MRRRKFISLLGGAVVAWPLPVSAQQPVKLATIGFLGAGAPSGTGHWVAAFVGRLRELGWTEGRNVAIEYRWAEGRTERSAKIVAEFVELKVDVIVTYGTAAVTVAKQATSVIPIVFAAAADPVGNSLVTSLARPGGNITGLSFQQTDTAAKRLELLRDVMPHLRRLAIMAHVASAGAMGEMSELQALASKLGVQATTVVIRQTQDIAPGIEALKGRTEALFVVTDPLVFTNRTRIQALALGARLPTVCLYKEYVEAGCLMSYGPNYPDLWRRTADFVDKILRGTKPGETPVEQPRRFEFVVNLSTAKALGLTIPQSVLLRADEVIQ